MLWCMHAWLLSRVQLFVTPRSVAHQAPLSMGFSSKNTGVGCHFFLQRIFLTLGWTWVSCITGRFLTVWATREAQEAHTAYKFLSWRKKGTTNVHFSGKHSQQWKGQCTSIRMQSFKYRQVPTSRLLCVSIYRVILCNFMGFLCIF